MAAVAVLDRLEEAFDAGIVRAADFQAAAVLVVVDQGAELPGDCGGQSGGLVAGDVLAAGGMKEPPRSAVGTSPAQRLPLAMPDRQSRSFRG